MCIVFIAFLVGMLGFSIYGYIEGDPYMLLAPLDADGNFCGYTSGYEDYPYLFYWDVDQSDVDTILGSSVCVSSTCPYVGDDGTEVISCIDTDYTSDNGGCETVPYAYDTYLCILILLF